MHMILQSKNVFVFYVQTHYSPKETRLLKTPEELSYFSACIECQNPTPDLYKFMGTLKVFDGERIAAKVSLGLENTLLRGARLKDTEFIHGTDFKVSF